jgi:hypothetical protein
MGTMEAGILRTILGNCHPSFYPSPVQPRQAILDLEGDCEMLVSKFEKLEIQNGADGLQEPTQSNILGGFSKLTFSKESRIFGLRVGV